MPKSTLSLAERFWAKVDKTGTPEHPECWVWTAHRMPSGYGQMNIGGGRKVYAHRMAYELVVGPIPEGLVTDHLCRNRACVNPAHLEPVTQKVNHERGEAHVHVHRWQEGSAALKRNKTHCKHGHVFDEANTFRPLGGGRVCRACQANYQRKLRARRREQNAAAAG